MNYYNNAIMNNKLKLKSMIKRREKILKRDKGYKELYAWDDV